MSFSAILSNHVLIAALAAWSLAQIIKLPVEFFRTGKWDWSPLTSAGGMPSSHSALMAGVAHAIGLYAGFDTPLFALAVAIAMIVIYDATGIRRQAGKHAEIINVIVQDLMEGHPLNEEHLREVLGHTPLQALMGTLLGIGIAQLVWLYWG
ncbi:MAG TPA: divergent PAP2 family protein [Chloroflexi bacterium]|nr:divergent PAP2 family protein [Chloroflexota bacterium]